MNTKATKGCASAEAPADKSKITKKWTVTRRLGRRGTCVFFVVFALFVPFVLTTAGQQLLDRVVARVGAMPITQTDVDAALAFGVIDRQAGDPVKQMIDRRLILAEVNRFPPPEPDFRVVQDLMVKMKATAGPDVNAVMKRTGVDDNRLSELARETLRIRSYLQQRFPSSARSEEQIARWLSDLRARGDVAEVPSPR
jgi:hypothetical protein